MNHDEEMGPMHGMYGTMDKGEGDRHRTEWYAATRTHGCMRCGRSSKKMTVPGKCDGPRWLEKDLNHKLKSW